MKPSTSSLFLVIGLLATLGCRPEPTQSLATDRERLVGTYSVSEPCSEGRIDTYNLDVVANGITGKQVWLRNLFNTGLSDIRAEVNDNVIRIPEQNILSPAGPCTVSGTGTVYNGEIGINYTLTDSQGGLYHCMASGVSL